VNFLGVLRRYRCGYCGREHDDRYERRDPLCPHRGDHMAEVEYVPTEQLRVAVQTLRFYAAYCGSTDGEADSGRRARDALKTLGVPPYGGP
jgi:hypothetical protein